MSPPGGAACPVGVNSPRNSPLPACFRGLPSIFRLFDCLFAVYHCLCNPGLASACSCTDAPEQYYFNQPDATALVRCLA